MKIKRLILHNFKSYRDVVISHIDHKANVIIGKNGHGKSNIHIGRLGSISAAVPFLRQVLQRLGRR